jgi:hypothetical protein
MKGWVLAAVAVAVACAIATNRVAINQQLAAVLCKTGETMDCELLRIRSQTVS